MNRGSDAQWKGIAGYATPVVGHVTVTLHVPAPGAVTARPQGGEGSASNAHPETANVASVLTPSAPTM